MPFIIDAGDELYFMPRRSRSAASSISTRSCAARAGISRALSDIAATKRPVLVPVNFPKPPHVHARAGDERLAGRSDGLGLRPPKIPATLEKPA